MMTSQQHNNIVSNTIEHKSCCRHSSCILILEATKYKALNEEDEDSNTALHLASMKGHIGIVELLINHGADKMARSAGAFAAASDGKSDECSARVHMCLFWL